MSNVATIERLTGPSIIATMAERYSMAPAAFEATLRATVIPKDCTREQFAAFLLVANEYGLNPILKEIYAFPAKGGGIQPVVGIDGWVKLANDHPMMDGIEFDDHRDEKGNLFAISAKVHRKDRSHPMAVTEYMSECKRNTDPWKQWPSRMLRHRATIQAIRYAFGYSSIFDADDLERMGGMRDVSPPPAPPAAPARAKRIAAPAPDTDTGEQARGDGYIHDDPPEVGNRQPQAADGDGGTAAELPQSNPATTSPSPPQAPADAGVPPRPLTADERKRLKLFAGALSSVNTPDAAWKGTERFWRDAGLGDDDVSPLALAANAIMDAHLGRTRGEISIADADQWVRKVLATP
jgi:phage recombination protein Bet